MAGANRAAVVKSISDSIARQQAVADAAKAAAAAIKTPAPAPAPKAAGK